MVKILVVLKEGQREENRLEEKTIPNKSYFVNILVRFRTCYRRAGNILTKHKNRAMFLLLHSRNKAKGGGSIGIGVDAVITHAVRY